MARRTGRRPGNPDTREAILRAAREAFAERGYDAASIRAIAAAAGVDPALVHHYFGNKDQLFLAAMDAPLNPAELLPKVLAGDRAGLGERLARMFLGVWDSPAGAAGVALLRSALSNEWTARLLREFITTQILRRVLEHLDVDPAELPLRGSLVASQLVGLVMVRHVVRLEPAASADPEILVAAVAPTLQRYLTAPLKV
ncbi:TetR family transcriptional regulator [Micromonospora endolithica]|uniref:TetR/AcrR family transcriptional regulator n=1 Tax=Micromonospora endolithica TaxID=230091 RepID=A0A3A9ZRG7_9ACTN|nr:TetR family transcriptional regulator [Micromonospora endolithica]RKN50751.1 TetR/AcrR family transcriptional regulator [Micromonospora endolithica]TWJ20501.1 TetR family transcriptional regulator [Micromonospora endolithica]